MTQEHFLKTIKEIVQADTSFDAAGWSKENPLWGHCAVVSLLAQEIFGGDIVKGSLLENPKYSYIRSHIWNRIDGKDVDFTAEQYVDISYKDLEVEIRTRIEILDNPDTTKRFNLLKERFLDKKIF